jgi:hypothetical protein
MSNIKFHTNRQVALQMAIEYRKGKVDNTPETVILQADEFYEWLQNAPMKDADQKYWLDGSTTSKPNKSHTL